MPGVAEQCVVEQRKNAHRVPLLQPIYPYPTHSTITTITTITTFHAQEEYQRLSHFSPTANFERLFQIKRLLKNPTKFGNLEHAPNHTP
jgi:hypothetical protein